MNAVLTRILAVAAAVVLVLALVALGVLGADDPPPEVQGAAPIGAADFRTPLPPGPFAGAFSPDGVTVAVFGASGLGVLTEEGSIRDLTGAGTNVVAFAWMPDATRIVVAEGPAATGELTLLDVDGEGGFRAPLDTPWVFERHPGLAVAPDGRTVAAVVTDREAIGGAASTDIVLIELLTGKSRRLALPGDQYAPRFMGEGDRIVVAHETNGTVATAVIDDAGTLTTLEDRAAPVGVIREGGTVVYVTGGAVVAQPPDAPARRLVDVPAGVEILDVHPLGGVALGRSVVDTADGRVTQLRFLELPSDRG